MTDLELVVHHASPYLITSHQTVPFVVFYSVSWYCAKLHFNLRRDMIRLITRKNIIKIQNMRKQTLGLFGKSYLLEKVHLQKKIILNRTVQIIPFTNRLVGICLI